MSITPKEERKGCIITYEITYKVTYKITVIMIKKIKQLRVEQHDLLLKLQALPKSREVATAITNLQQSRMWLGEALGVLGAQNPYPESMNPSNDIVHPPADTVAFNENKNYRYD